MARWYIIDENRKIEGGVKGYPTKKEAERTRLSLIKSRSRRGQKIYNREFGRSLNLKVVKGD